MRENLKRKFALATCLFFTSIGSLLTAQAQTWEVTGIVTSADDGEPVVGASVLVNGANIGSVTDLNGKFNLTNVPSSAKTLHVSYVGLIAQDVAIKSGLLRVVLQSDARLLNEVVITALGISREKKALGYAVSEVSGDEMLKARGGVNNPINSLQGKVAGLQIIGGSGLMGGSSKVLIRGVSSISGNNQPLFVIDGVPIEGTDYNSIDTQRGAGGFDYGNLIQDINPDDIDNISVLKGPNASALYGSRANNGVVMITTKKGKADEKYGVTFNSSVGFETVNKLPKMQKLYGGGYGGVFEEAEINGQTYNYADMYTDESWGPKYEGQTYLSWYDLAKWEVNGKKGNPTTSVWQTPAHDIDDFF
ncbi:TonB-dependent receptor SusC [termite gut metagenome]|uniref:TonB-dependent receptor SusC n=1 Tax=termite gut metagenome TaxID=433724 RepID=A0A5J4QKY8_9ZZZZ